MLSRKPGVSVALTYFTFDVNELLFGQRLTVHRVRPILGDILLDKPALEHLAGYRGDAWVLGDLVRDCD